MRVEYALPVLAGAAAVNAQGLNFDSIFAVKPALKHVEPTTTKPVNRAATASSIVSVLESRHAKTALPTSGTLKPSTKKPAPTSASSKKALPPPKASSTHKASSSPKASPTPKGGIRAKRATNGNCAAQSIAYGYQPTPNTPTGFLTDVSLANQALTVLPPPGFTKVFSGLSGSMFASNYITYYPLASYDPTLCSNLCTLTAGCQSFNLYFERDPTLDPNSLSCPNPTAATAVRCALWGSQITAAQALNIGEWRADFMVVITGSNAYSKNTAPAAISGYTGPTALSGLVNVQTLNGKNVVAGSNFFTGAYDPTKCTALCASTNAANKASAIASGLASYTVCSYVNAAILSVNGVAQGTYCALYSDSGVASFATQQSQTYNAVAYDISYSYGYAMNSVDSGLTGITTTSRTTTTTTTAAASSSSSASTTTSTATTTTSRSLSAATPTGATCANLGGNTYIDLNGITYQTKCGYDLLNVGDIANANVPSYSDCFTLCDVTANCDGFAYVPSSRWCYMKKLGSTVTTVPNANSGVDLAWLPGRFTDRSVTTTTSSTTTSTTTTSRTSTTTTTR